MKKVLLLAVCLALSAAGLASAETIIKVGYLAALTGDWAAYGLDRGQGSTARCRRD